MPRILFILFSWAVFSSLQAQWTLTGPPTGARACPPCEITQFDSTTAYNQYTLQAIRHELSYGFELPDFEEETIFYEIKNYQALEMELKHRFLKFNYGEITPTLTFKVFVNRAGRMVEICTDGTHINNADFEILPTLTKIRLPKLLPWQQKGQKYRLLVFEFDGVDLLEPTGFAPQPRKK
ncbi:MAG: hypothetical protein AAF570_03275 [Bacteroidota bacterium]